METNKVEGFNVIGITVRTSNNNGESSRDIGGLWQKFMSEQVVAKIPNKISDEIYSIYTEYEGDYTKPYTTMLGCKVSTLDDIPEGMAGMQFNSGNYTKFVAQGNLMQGAVINKWQEIWAMEATNLKRVYTQDFEVYGAKALNPQDAEVDIFIAVN